MSLATVAILGIALGFLLIVVGCCMDFSERKSPEAKPKMVKKSKKRVPLRVLKAARRRAA